MTEEIGLTRTPYYPQLSVVNRSDTGNDPSAVVLSVMLYWHSQEKHVRFNARNHLHLLASNLCLTPQAVKDSLEYLCTLGILTKEVEVFTTQSEDPEKREKVNEFYSLDFHNLHQYLQKRNLNIPIKILRMASDDYFDFYSYLSPSRLPKVQGLVGMIKGDDYNTAALNICTILCSICSQDDYEDFSYKALAPGWRMLCQPPAVPEDLAERYLRKNERSIDIDLMDGSFFVPDGDYFGTEKHKIWHSGKSLEPRILAAALYLCITATCSHVEFYSDLSLPELKDSFELLYRFTGLKGRLSQVYFNYKGLQGKDLIAAQEEYQSIMRSLI